MPQKKNEKENNFKKSMGCSKSSSKRKFHTNSGLPQEARKISNKQPDFPSKRIRKMTTNKCQNQQKEENQRIDKIELQKKTDMNHETNSYPFEETKNVITFQSDSLRVKEDASQETKKQKRSNSN